MRHVGADDRIRRAAYVVAAREAEPSAFRELASALAPAGALDDFIYAFGKTIALHAESVDGDTRRLEQVTTANFWGIEIYLCGKFIKLRFEGEANVDGAVPTHGAARGLVGEHAVAVVLNVRDIVESAE